MGRRRHGGVRSARGYLESPKPPGEPGLVLVTLDNLEPIARLLPSLDVVAVSQAPSPESNPDSPLPVVTMVGTDSTIES